MRYVQSVARVTETTTEAMPKGANFAGPFGAARPLKLQRNPVLVDKVYRGGGLKHCFCLPLSGEIVWFNGIEAIN